MPPGTPFPPLPSGGVPEPGWPRVSTRNTTRWGPSRKRLEGSGIFRNPAGPKPGKEHSSSSVLSPLGSGFDPPGKSFFLGRGPAHPWWEGAARPDRSRTHARTLLRGIERVARPFSPWFPPRGARTRPQFWSPCVSSLTGNKFPRTGGRGGRNGGNRSPEDGRGPLPFFSRSRGIIQAGQVPAPRGRVRAPPREPLP
jgi:hypothetical protein